MKLITILSFLGLLAAFGLAQTGPKWTTLPITDGISVKFPGVPRAEPLRKGPSGMTMQFWSLKSSEGEFIVVFGKPGPNDKEEPQHVLHSLVQSGVDRNPDGLIEEGSSSVRGWPAAHFSMADEEFMGSFKAVVVRSNMVCLAFRYSPEGPMPEAGTVFLHSLDISNTIGDDPDPTDATAYQRYTVGNKLSAIFPRKPVLTEHPLIDDLSVNTYLAGDLSQAYEIVMESIPAKSVTPEMARELIVDSFIGSGKVKETKRSKTQIGADDALRVEGIMPSGVQVICIGFTHNTGVFAAVWLGPKATRQSPNIEAFFKSISFAQ